MSSVAEGKWNDLAKRTNGPREMAWVSAASLVVA